MWRQYARGELWRSRAPIFLMQGVLKSVSCPSAWFGQCLILPGKVATNLLAPNHSFCHPFMVVATADQRTLTLPSQQQLQTWLSRAWIAICYPWLYYCGQLTPLPISITCSDCSAIEMSRLDSSNSLSISRPVEKAVSIPLVHLNPLLLLFQPFPGEVLNVMKAEIECFWY